VTEAGERAPARGTLYVVSTPIGNLGDVTLRALEVLRAVSVVAAEDTRLTRRLWARHGVETPLVSYHAQSPDSRRQALLERLERGEDVALVTDAGTPLVSDPGGDLVTAWAERGGTVVPVPGASAVLAALVASGIAAARWGFEGFLPRSGGERKRRLARIAQDDRATVLFEAPGRTAATLRDLAAAAGGERQAAVARELTKRHEEIRRGTLAELAAVAATDPPRGEVTIVVAGADAEVATQRAATELPAAQARVAELVEGGASRADASRQVARETGLSRRQLYAAPDRRHDEATDRRPDSAPEGRHGASPDRSHERRHEGDDAA
jgi:16S rRNA (cytidine1402-2'-O)-methyltransferase